MTSFVAPEYAPCNHAQSVRNDPGDHKRRQRRAALTVAEPGLSRSFPSCLCASNLWVCPVTRMSTSSCRRLIASASFSPHGMICSNQHHAQKVSPRRMRDQPEERLPRRSWAPHLVAVAEPDFKLPDRHDLVLGERGVLVHVAPHDVHIRTHRLEVIHHADRAEIARAQDVLDLPRHLRAKKRGSAGRAIVRGRAAVGVWGRTSSFLKRSGRSAVLCGTCRRSERSV